MKYGIEETKEVLALLPVLIAAYKKAAEDGIADWKDLLNEETRAVLPSLYQAYEGSNLVLAELKDLDSEEAGEIYALLSKVVMDAFGLFK